MIEEVVVIPGDKPILPSIKKRKVASMTSSDKKRKVATMTSSVKDLKDNHEKKWPGVKFE